MFGFFKRSARSESTLTEVRPGPWELSEDKQFLDRIEEYTYPRLDAQKVDLESQTFIWMARER